MGSQPTPYQLTITLDDSTRDKLRDGKYALHLGRLADISDITDPENENSRVQDLSGLQADNITQPWTPPSGGAATEYMISYSTVFIPNVKQPQAEAVIPRMVSAAPGEAFELLTKGEPLEKMPVTPSWVLEHPGTIGFKNSTPNVPAQPLLYASTNTNTPIFGTPSMCIPGQGRLKVPVENKVFAWFANAGSDNISGFETVDFSTVVELKFRRGKNIAIKYTDSDPKGWFDQELTDITPVPPPQ